MVKVDIQFTNWELFKNNKLIFLNGKNYSMFTTTSCPHITSFQMSYKIDIRLKSFEQENTRLRPRDKKKTSNSCK